MTKDEKRVIRQVNEFWSKQEAGFIDWNKVSDDFFNKKSKREMMRNYGFTSFQYKVLKKYMTGE